MQKKKEIREYYATHKNYRDMVRVFDHQDSIVRIIYKEAPPKKRPAKGNLVVSNKVTVSRETKKEQESLNLI